MSRSAAPVLRQDDCAPRQARECVLRASFPDRQRALLASLPVQLVHPTEQRLSTSFPSNEACDQPFGFSRPCETRSPPRHVEWPALLATDIRNITRQGRRVRPFTAVPRTETGPVKPSGSVRPRNILVDSGYY